MTQAEKILIRWLSAFSAGLSGAGAAIIGFEADVPRTVLIAIVVGSAALSGMVASLTGEAISRTFGVRGS